jgi:Polyketide cyclase / dehydrase and lipid transport
MADQETPDFVIGAGAPAPPVAPVAAPRPDAMPVVTAATWAAVSGMLLGPIVLALVVRLLTSQDSWAPLSGLWIVAIALVLGAGWAMEQADKLQKSYLHAPVHRPGENEKVAIRQALGFGLVALAEAAAAASFELWVGLAVIGLTITWIGWCAITPQRHLQSGFVLQVNCSPEAAFGLIADPRNLNRYERREVLIPPFPESNGLGSVRHVRATAPNGKVIDADEMVTAYVPPRLLTVTLMGIRHLNEGTYEIEPHDGGTQLRYTYRSSRPISQLLLGNLIDRSKAVAKLQEMWRERSQRLKALLETEAPASV